MSTKLGILTTLIVTSYLMIVQCNGYCSDKFLPTGSEGTGSEKVHIVDREERDVPGHLIVGSKPDVSFTLNVLPKQMCLNSSVPSCDFKVFFNTCMTRILIDRGHQRKLSCKEFRLRVLVSGLLTHPTVSDVKQLHIDGWVYGKTLKMEPKVTELRSDGEKSWCRALSFSLAHAHHTKGVEGLSAGGHVAFRGQFRKKALSSKFSRTSLSQKTMKMPECVPSFYNVTHVYRGDTSDGTLKLIFPRYVHDGWKFLANFDREIKRIIVYGARAYKLHRERISDEVVKSNDTSIMDVLHEHGHMLKAIVIRDKSHNEEQIAGSVISTRFKITYPSIFSYTPQLMSLTFLDDCQDDWNVDPTKCNTVIPICQQKSENVF